MNSQMKRYIRLCLGRSQVKERLSPWSHLLGMLDVFTNLKVFRLCAIEILWRRPLALPALLSRELGRRVENSKPLILASAFWGPAPIREPFKSSPRVASLKQKMLLVLLSLRYLQGFKEPFCQGLGTETK